MLLYYIILHLLYYYNSIVNTTEKYSKVKCKVKLKCICTAFYFVSYNIVLSY